MAYFYRPGTCHALISNLNFTQLCIFLFFPWSDCFGPPFKLFLTVPKNAMMKREHESSCKVLF